MLGIILDAEDVREVKHGIPIFVGLFIFSCIYVHIGFSMTELNGCIITFYEMQLLGGFLKIGLDASGITKEI